MLLDEVERDHHGRAEDDCCGGNAADMEKEGK